MDPQAIGFELTNADAGITKHVVGLIFAKYMYVEPYFTFWGLCIFTLLWSHKNHISSSYCNVQGSLWVK